MAQNGDFRLNERLGLLQAICIQKGYFSDNEVSRLELPLSEAISHYGEAALPAASAVTFERWGSQPIIAGLLNEPAETASLPFIRCAATAQQLLGAHAIDMLVLLIGPDGSHEEQAWQHVAAAIEDSDRICRKLVWLPADDVAKGAELFLARSPFARPWRGVATIATQANALDELVREEDELDEIAIRAQSDGADVEEFVRRVMSGASDG